MIYCYLRLSLDHFQAQLLNSKKFLFKSRILSSEELPRVSTFETESVPKLTVAPWNGPMYDANHSQSCEFDRTCEK